MWISWVSLFDCALARTDCFLSDGQTYWVGEHCIGSLATNNFLLGTRRGNCELYCEWWYKTVKLLKLLLVYSVRPKFYTCFEQEQLCVLVISPTSRQEFNQGVSFQFCSGDVQCVRSLVFCHLNFTYECGSSKLHNMCLHECKKVSVGSFCCINLVYCWCIDLEQPFRIGGGEPLRGSA